MFVQNGAKSQEGKIHEKEIDDHQEETEDHAQGPGGEDIAVDLHPGESIL